ncbi:hypothetical protein AABB24_039831, partial [Solanum stoloniferum]
LFLIFFTLPLVSLLSSPVSLRREQQLQLATTAAAPMRRQLQQRVAGGSRTAHLFPLPLSHHRSFFPSALSSLRPAAGFERCHQQRDPNDATSSEQREPAADPGKNTEPAVAKGGAASFLLPLSFPLFLSSLSSQDHNWQQQLLRPTVAGDNT